MDGTVSLRDSVLNRRRSSPVQGFEGKRPYRELDHTADLCIEIAGRDEEDLFRNAVESLYRILGLPAAPAGGRAPAAETLRIQGGDHEEALVDLLGELLYRVTVERRRFLLQVLSLREAEQGGWVVELTGAWQKLTEAETQGRREIKAVTYHDVRIRRTPRGFVARVVMDV